MNPTIARSIVVACIRRISRLPQVDINGTLEDADIFDQDRVLLVVDRIVSDDVIGVPSIRYAIDHRWFRHTTPKTPVLKCIQTLLHKSVPVTYGKANFWPATADEVRMTLDPDIDEVDQADTQ